MARLDFTNIAAATKLPFAQASTWFAR